MSDHSTNENIIQRLRRRISETRRLGFDVRIEHLDDEQAGWCQIGTRRTIFIDISVSAREQLAQLDEALDQFAQSEPAAQSAAAREGTKFGGVKAA